jgi:GcrA cell cycle regulator
MGFCMAKDDTIWTAEFTERFKALWGKKTCLQIQKELGISKNAAIGKARRLGLTGNDGKSVWTDAEIARFTEMWNSGASYVAIQRELKKSKDALSNKRAKLGLNPRNSWGCTKNPDRFKLVEGVEKTKTPKPYVPTRPSRYTPNDATCAWITGDVKKEHRYCGDPVFPGKPFCSHHCSLAYVRVA